MFGEHVNCVALVSSDIERTVHIFGHLLATEPRCVTDLGEAYYVMPVGRTAISVFPKGHNCIPHEARPGVNHIEVGLKNPAQWIEKLSISSKVVARRGKSDIYALDSEHFGGVAIRVSEPVDSVSQLDGHVQRIDHLGIASKDVYLNEKVFAGGLGLQVESRQTDMEVINAIESFTSDKYGVVYHARAPQPIGGLRVTFITIGDFELEFLANFNPSQTAVIEHGAHGTTKQDQGAITRSVESRGEGLHHLALKVKNIDGTLSSLKNIGVDLIDHVGRPGSRRARIGFIHPKAVGGILIHLVERDD